MFKQTKIVSVLFIIRKTITFQHKLNFSHKELKKQIFVENNNQCNVSLRRKRLQQDTTEVTLLLITYQCKLAEDCEKFFWNKMGLNSTKYRNNDFVFFYWTISFLDTQSYYIFSKMYLSQGKLIKTYVLLIMILIISLGKRLKLNWSYRHSIKDTYRYHTFSLVSILLVLAN